MIARVAVLVVLGWLAGSVAAAEIYKWIDEHGQTQYGNSVPKAHRSQAKAIELDPEVTDAQRDEAQARSVKERALAESMTRERQKAAQKVAPKPSVPPAPVKPVSSGPGPSDKKRQCEEDWKRYQESQACFAPYRTANGGIKAEAFQHCAELKQPAPCQ